MKEFAIDNWYWIVPAAIIVCFISFKKGSVFGIILGIIAAILAALILSVYIPDITHWFNRIMQ